MRFVEKFRRNVIDKITASKDDMIHKDNKLREYYDQELDT